MASDYMIIELRPVINVKKKRIYKNENKNILYDGKCHNYIIKFRESSCKEYRKSHIV